MPPKKWDNNTFVKTMLSVHREYSSSISRITDENYPTFLNYIKHNYSALSSEIGRRSRKESYKGEVLETCGISPWLHFLDKRPLGRNEEEVKDAILYFWNELQAASESLNCKITLNEKLEKYRIKPPPHYRLERYSECKSCNCSECHDDTISAAATIRILKNKYGKQWQSELTKLALAANTQLTSDSNSQILCEIKIKHFSALHHISQIGTTHARETAEYTLSLLLISNKTEKDWEKINTIICEYGKSLDDLIYHLALQTSQKISAENLPALSKNPLYSSELPISLCLHEVSILHWLQSITDDSNEKEKIDCLLHAQSATRFSELSTCFKQSSGTGGIQKVRQTINAFFLDSKVFLLDLVFKILGSDEYTYRAITNLITKMHSQWHHKRMRNDGIEFDIDYIFACSPQISKWISSHKKGIRSIYADSSINPNCHLREFYYGSSLYEEKQNALKLMRHLEAQFGIENLNSGTVGVRRRNEIINLPALNEYPEKYTACRSLGCMISPPKAGAFFAKCQKLFGSWESALHEYGIDYQTQVLRKKHRVKVDTVLQELDSFVRVNPDWTVMLLKERNQTLYRAIYKKRDQGKLIFSSFFKGDAMRSAHAEIKYRSIPDQISQKEFLEKYKDILDMDWQLRRNFDDTAKARGRLFEQWFCRALIRNGFTEAEQDQELKEYHFLHNRALKDVSAGKRPDFRFTDAIIDLKTTYFQYQKKTLNQFLSYSKISKNLYCITLKQDFVHQINDCVSVKVVSLPNACRLIPELKGATFLIEEYEEFMRERINDVINDQLAVDP